MVGHDGRAAVDVLENHMAATLPDGLEAKLMEDADYLSVGKWGDAAGQGRLGLYADPLDPDDSAGRNPLDVEVELDGLPHVEESLLRALALRVAARKHGHVGDPGFRFSFFQDDVEFHGQMMRDYDTYSLLRAERPEFLGAGRSSFFGGGP